MLPKTAHRGEIAIIKIAIRVNEKMGELMVTTYEQVERIRYFHASLLTVRRYITSIQLPNTYFDISDKSKIFTVEETFRTQYNTKTCFTYSERSQLELFEFKLHNISLHILSLNAEEEEIIRGRNI